MRNDEIWRPNVALMIVVVVSTPLSPDDELVFIKLPTYLGLSNRRDQIFSLILWQTAIARRPNTGKIPSSSFITLEVE